MKEDQTRFKTGLLPSALVVVVLAVLLNIGLQYLAPNWAVEAVARKAAERDVSVRQMPTDVPA